MLAPQRPAFGERHALGERHGLVVPRRFAVVGVAELVRWRRGISAALCSGESAVTPAPSSDTSPAKKPFSQARCSAENGAVSGTSEGIGGATVWLIPTASASNIRFSASASWRLRVKARKRLRSRAGAVRDR